MAPRGQGPGRAQVTTQARRLNVGLNDGRAAGQSAEHAHVHVTPRSDGDLESPRAGVRWVLPERAAYWDE